MAKLALTALTDLLVHSDSDTVRVAAARALMDRLKPTETDAQRRSARKDRADALAETRALLAELAALKAGQAADPTPCGAERAAALDQGRAASAADAAG